MKENEISFTFHIDKGLMEEFEKVMVVKSKEIGLDLKKKQALQLAIKEAIVNWTTKKPGE